LKGTGGSGQARWRGNRAKAERMERRCPEGCLVTARRSGGGSDKVVGFAATDTGCVSRDFIWRRLLLGFFSRNSLQSQARKSIFSRAQMEVKAFVSGRSRYSSCSALDWSCRLPRWCCHTIDKTRMGTKKDPWKFKHILFSFFCADGRAFYSFTSAFLYRATMADIIVPTTYRTVFP